MRNSSLTCIAPTGSISMVADCSSGCEPIFALAFRKNVVKSEGMFFVNKYFRQIAHKEGFYSETLMEQIVKKGSVKGIKTIPKHIQSVFVTAHEIKPMDHVKMQSILQKYVDNAISKTINMPNDATVQDVAGVYMSAWKSGCKGITIFRDGSRQIQILSKGNKKQADDNGTDQIQSKVRITPINKQ